MTPEQRREWLESRRSGLGSSDAAAVVGLSRWSSPLGVWLEKTGRLGSAIETPQMAWGTRLEEAIAAAYAEMEGRPVALPPQAILRHPERTWQLASLDRISEDRILELKTAGAYHHDEWGEPGTDAIPEAYVIQTHHQMAVTGMVLADVAVLIGGSDFRVYHIERNDDLIERLNEIESAFWQRVQNDDPPEPDWQHPRTIDLIEAMHPVRGGEVTLTDAALAIADDFEAAGRMIVQGESLKAEAKARLIHLMGDAAIALLPDGRVYERKIIQRKGYSVEPSEYVQFRAKKLTKRRTA